LVIGYGNIVGADSFGIIHYFLFIESYERLKNRQGSGFTEQRDVFHCLRRNLTQAIPCNQGLAPLGSGYPACHAGHESPEEYQLMAFYISRAKKSHLERVVRNEVKARCPLVRIERPRELLHFRAEN